MLAILDTSVIISAFTGNKTSSSAQLINMFNKKQLPLAICDESLMELKNTISKPSIKNLKNFDHKNIAKFIAVYIYNAIKFDIKNAFLGEINSRDVNDDIFLKLAIASKTNYLISLDNDLLVLEEVDQAKVLKPSEFLSDIKQNSRL